MEQEIETAIRQLNLSADDVSLLSPEENRHLYNDLLSTFVNGRDRHWWWEDFRSGFAFKDFDKPFEHLNELMPDLNSKVWFMVEDTQQNFYPIYDVKPKLLKDIIGNCFAFEYYIISKDKSWLICENHHDKIIGVGDILKRHNAALLET